MTNRLVDVDALAARVPNGAKLAVFKEPCVPMDLIRALIRRQVRDLHLVTIPAGNFQAELLIAGGCVATIETSGVSLGEFGPAPAFTEAVKSGALKILDATCPAIYAQMQAGEKGQPFTTLRGLIGSDVLKYRDDFTVIDNPFPPHDPVAVLPPIKPDVGVIHAPLADRNGNVWIGRQPELKTLAHASATCLVTVEEIVDFDLMADERYSAAVVPEFYISGLAHAPRGAWPIATPGYHERDDDHLAAYSSLAATPEGRADYLNAHVFGREAAE